VKQRRSDRSVSPTSNLMCWEMVQPDMKMWMAKMNNSHTAVKPFA
jgi:hypothetical protein